MVKKLFFIFVLLIAILSGVIYLTEDASRAVTFSIDGDIKPIIILSDDYFSIYEGDAFYPENFIGVYHPDTCILAIDKSYDTTKIGTYTIDILATCGGSEATSTMSLEVVSKEVEIVTVEKVITEYISVVGTDDSLLVTENIKEDSSFSEETAYFYGHHDITLPSGSSVSTLIQALSSDIVTNIQVTIDYAEVDLSCRGAYKAYYYTAIGIFTVYVTIY